MDVYSFLRVRGVSLVLSEDSPKESRHTMNDREMEYMREEIAAAREARALADVKRVSLMVVGGVVAIFAFTLAYSLTAETVEDSINWNKCVRLMNAMGTNTYDNVKACTETADVFDGMPRRNRGF